MNIHNAIIIFLAFQPTKGDSRYKLKCLSTFFIHLFTCKCWKLKQISFHYYSIMDGNMDLQIWHLFSWLINCLIIKSMKYQKIMNKSASYFRIHLWMSGFVQPKVQNLEMFNLQWYVTNKKKTFERLQPVNIWQFFFEYSVNLLLDWLIVSLL